MNAHVLCEFRPDGVCRRCGRKVKSDPAKTLAHCTQPCAHLGDHVGSVKTDCYCGGGERDASAFVCRRHGRCLPHYRPDAELLRRWRLRQPEASIYHLCHGCESFRPLQPPASNTSGT